MALATYNDLLVEIPAWAWRTGDADFLAAVPSFIALAEDLMNNGTDDMSPIRNREMEADVSLVLTDNVGDLPDDYLEYRSVVYGPRDTPLPGDQFTIVGNEFRTTRQGVSPLAIGYFKRIPALGPSNQTNWLIQKNKQVYLFGALLMAEPFMRSDERMSTWGSLYAKAVAGLNNSDFVGKYKGTTVRTAGYAP